MPTSNFTTCPSPIALQRITNARWTPYVGDTWRNWAREALMAVDACASCRAGDCEACKALQKISALPWSEALGESMVQTARDGLGLHSARKFMKRETICTSA